MIPIQQLLQRIQWDPQFGAGKFTVGYFDRRAKRVIRVPFQRMVLESGKHFSFDLEDDNGTMRMVPFHRVRQVWRNGVLIWERPTSAQEREPQDQDQDRP